uniref:Uncharacterized protein n=1 Tax=Myoviridae sp. ctqfO1 TaxID=2827710 RepID=A0A8S5T2V0_9CAUD|nr:MAG TPA: hypothetical protein [Myoviridae sp. ctqfO1]
MRCASGNELSPLPYSTHLLPNKLLGTLSIVVALFCFHRLSTGLVPFPC